MGRANKETRVRERVDAWIDRRLKACIGDVGRCMFLEVRGKGARVGELLSLRGGGEEERKSVREADFVRTEEGCHIWHIRI